jgi:hypothetical protein
VDTYDVDGFKIYVKKSIKARDDVVTLDLQKYLFKNKITIDGLQLITRT